MAMRWSIRELSGVQSEEEELFDTKAGTLLLGWVSSFLNTLLEHKHGVVIWLCFSAGLAPFGFVHSLMGGDLHTRAALGVEFAAIAAALLYFWLSARAVDAEIGPRIYPYCDNFDGSYHVYRARHNPIPDDSGWTVLALLYISSWGAAGLLLLWRFMPAQAPYREMAEIGMCVVGLMGITALVIAVRTALMCLVPFAWRGE